MSITNVISVMFFFIFDCCVFFTVGNSGCTGPRSSQLRVCVTPRLANKDYQPRREVVTVGTILPLHTIQYIVIHPSGQDSTRVLNPTPRTTVYYTQ